MYSDTITLFNRNEDKWYPTILRGVDLNMDKAAIIAKYGDQSADNAVLHIKCTYKSDGVYVGGKKWLPPKEWDVQEESELLQTLTFTSGNNFDFFIAGEWPDDEVINENDYLDGFYNMANQRYDYVFAISSVALYTVIPHFEIMAK